MADAYERRFLDELDAKPADRELLRRFAPEATGTVLEVGCGPGQIGAFLRRIGCRVVGLDLSPRMAGLARARLDAALAGDMRSCPSPPAGSAGWWPSTP